MMVQLIEYPLFVSIVPKLRHIAIGRNVALLDKPAAILLHQFDMYVV